MNFSGEPLTLSSAAQSSQGSPTDSEGQYSETPSIGSRASRRSINALALNLQSSKSSDAVTRPIIIVQDEDMNENSEVHEQQEYTPCGPTAIMPATPELRRKVRSKSSPSTPVSAHLDLSSVSTTLILQ